MKLTLGFSLEVVVCVCGEDWNGMSCVSLSRCCSFPQSVCPAGAVLAVFIWAKLEI